jgi:hypothetical protein
LENVYNFDETALFYRLEPDSTLTTKRISGRKKDKERITVAFCANATGTHKLKPFIIGKYANPRCFKNVNIQNIGITYKNNRKAWMTAVIFREWLLSFDKQMKSKNRNILRIIDNATSHNVLNLNLTNI